MPASSNGSPSLIVTILFQLIIAVTICNGPQVSFAVYTLVESPQVREVSVESLSIDVRASMGGGDGQCKPDFGDVHYFKTTLKNLHLLVVVTCFDL